MLLNFRMVVGLVVGAALPGPALSQSPRPRPGDVQRVTVITLALGAGSTEKEAKRVTYTPPPGWYVRGHTVDCTQKTGHSSFTVNTVPRAWSYVTEEQLRESYRGRIEAAGRCRDAALEGRLAVEQEQALTELRRGRSSHHALVVEAVARGEGFLRGGGSIQLSVTAELVYVGTREALAEGGPPERDQASPSAE